MLLDRERLILDAVVNAFVRDGVPVSSRGVKERLGLPISTATIRNDMVRLEHGGYLAKPHTSAGRVPTDMGYRAYVDNLDGDFRYGEAFAHEIREHIRDDAPDIGTVMACASRILGALSRNFAMVYGSVIQESRVERIQLIGLDGARLLVIVNLNPDYERTTVLRMEKSFEPNVIAGAERWINQVAAGAFLQDAKDALDQSIRDNVTDEGIITREIAVHREEILSEPPALELYFEERGHLLGQPELADPKLLHLLLRILHTKGYLTRLLSERGDEQPRVTIGDEHTEQELRPFSLVTAGYRMGAARGVLGVIGPTRMRYDLVYSLVGSAARELGTIGDEYF